MSPRFEVSRTGPAPADKERRQDPESPNDSSSALAEEEPGEGGALEKEQDLPPVVARLVVEIRSDGTRTIARGAMEDRVTGEQVALRADASTPMALVQQLTGALLKTPVFARQTLEGLLPKALGRRLRSRR